MIVTIILIGLVVIIGNALLWVNAKINHEYHETYDSKDHCNSLANNTISLGNNIKSVNPEKRKYCSKRTTKKQTKLKE